MKRLITLVVVLLALMVGSASAWTYKDGPVNQIDDWAREMSQAEFVELMNGSWLPIDWPIFVVNKAGGTDMATAVITHASVGSGGQYIRHIRLPVASSDPKFTIWLNQFRKNISGNQCCSGWPMKFNVQVSVITDLYGVLIPGSVVTTKKQCVSPEEFMMSASTKGQ